MPDAERRPERRAAPDTERRTERGAAFFDLDKTLIQGSSAVHFARAAYRHGMLSRGQLARDAWANVRFRVRGSTDEMTEALSQRIL